MKIAVDLDEILAEFLASVIAFHNDTYKTKLSKSDFHSYKYWEVWGGNRDEAIQKVYDFHQTPYFQNIKPVAGAIEAIMANTVKSLLTALGIMFGVAAVISMLAIGKGAQQEVKYE